MQDIVMNNGAPIMKATLISSDTLSGYLVGVVICHWGNIDPNEHVVWDVKGRQEPEEQYGPIRLDVVGSGAYLYEREDQIAEFNKRSERYWNWDTRGEETPPKGTPEYDQMMERGAERLKRRIFDEDGPTDEILTEVGAITEFVQEWRAERGLIS